MKRNCLELRAKWAPFLQRLTSDERKKFRRRMNELRREFNKRWKAKGVKR